MGIIVVSQFITMKVLVKIKVDDSAISPGFVLLSELSVDFFTFVISVSIVDEYFTVRTAVKMSEAVLDVSVFVTSFSIIKSFDINLDVIGNLMRVRDAVFIAVSEVFDSIPDSIFFFFVSLPSFLSFYLLI